MSSVQKTIEIIFAGTDKLSGTMTSITKGMGDFDNSVQSMAQPLSNVADGVLKVDAALAAMVLGGMALAINQAGKFGDSFNEISTLTNASAANLDQFKDDIVNYARDSTASFDDINASIYSAISAGVDYKDSLQVLNTAEKLSVAGKADLEATTRVLVSSLNAYGASTNEAASYSDALFKTVQLGQTTLPELAASLAQVTTTAANSGVSFDELMASIAAITATGAPTSQAITAIRAAISAIIKPSSEAAKEAERLGIQFDAGALASKGLNGVLKDVYTSTGGATEEIVKLFGSIESLPAVMTLGADTSGKFATTLEAFKDKAGATAEAYGKMAENFTLTNQNLANNVKATFIDVGDKLLGNYTGIVKELADIFGSIGEGVDAGAFDPLFEAINAAGEDIIKFMNELGESIPEALGQVDFTKLIDALQSLGGSVGSIFADFDPSDPESVAKAIQGVVDTIASLITVTEGMVDSFKPLIAGILNSVEAFNQMDTADQKAAGNVLGLAKALVTLGTGITTVLLLVGDNAEKMEIFFDTILGAIEMLWGGFKVTIQSVAAAVLLAIDGILQGLELVTWGDWNDKVKSMRDGVSEELKGLEERFDKSVQEVNAGIAKITDHIDPLKPEIDTTQVQTDADEIRDIFAKMQAGIIVTTNFEDVQDEWDLINSEFENSDITAELTVVTNFDSVQSDFDGMIDDINTVTGKSLEIKMPFTIMYKWTDSSGSEHYSNQVPDSQDIMGEISEIRIPMIPEIKKEADTKISKEVEQIKEELEKSLTAKFDLALDKASLEKELADVKKFLEIEVLVKSNFDQVNTALEISERAYEAYAGTVVAAYMSGSEIVSAASDSIAGLYGSMKGGLKDYDIQDSIERQESLQRREMDLREKLARQNEEHLVKQEQLTERQIIALNNHRATLKDYLKAMDGERTITLDLSGVEPEVEMVMWKILKAIQVRANESGAEFLLAAAA